MQLVLVPLSIVLSQVCYSAFTNDLVFFPRTPIFVFRAQLPHTIWTKGQCADQYHKVEITHSIAIQVMINYLFVSASSYLEN